MAETFELKASPRVRTGTKECRRLRRAGVVPGNLFGHNQDPTPVRFDGEEMRHLLQRGAKVVDVQIDGNTEKALLTEVQWDTFGQHVLHVDFMRVDANERIEVVVPIHTRGTAPGVLAGGILEQPHHEVSVECLVVEVPQEFVVRVGSMNIGDSVHVSDLESLVTLPASLKVLTPPDDVLIQITEPKEVPEEEEAAEGEPAEPELIGKSAESEDGDES